MAEILLRARDWPRKLKDDEVLLLIHALEKMNRAAEEAGELPQRRGHQLNHDLYEEIKRRGLQWRFEA